MTLPLPPLTERQAAILLAVRRHAAEHGRPPSIRDLAKAFGVTISSMDVHLARIRAKGYAVRLAGSWRDQGCPSCMRLTAQLAEVAEALAGLTHLTAADRERVLMLRNRLAGEA